MSTDTLDIPTLDRYVRLLNSGSPAETKRAEEYLLRFQNDESAWRQVDGIFERTDIQPQTKYIAASALQTAIQLAWGAMAQTDRDGIRDFVSGFVITVSKDPQQLVTPNQKALLVKMNGVLVEILKHVWPQQWPDFLDLLMKSSRHSEAMCENNFRILKRLSEDIFEPGRCNIPNARRQEMQVGMECAAESLLAYTAGALASSGSASMLTEVLEFFQRFLVWLPAQYAYDSGLVSVLGTKFLPSPRFRNAVLRCFIEVLSKDASDNQIPIVLVMFAGTSKVIFENLLPLPHQSNRNLQSSIDYTIQQFSTRSDDDEAFVENICVFFGTILRKYLKQIEDEPALRSLLREANVYLICLSYVDHSETLKICCEYFAFLVQNVLDNPSTRNFESRLTTIYNDLFEEISAALVSTMVKPEEVILTEDENGNVIREILKNVEVQQQYLLMQGCLQCLARCNSVPVEKIVMDKLTVEVNWVAERDGHELRRKEFNSLCWSIGALSGSMSVDQEKMFVIACLHELLKLIDTIKTKCNKAIIAGNIMYIASQYPRFLSAYWNFMKTVIFKLFEFMHEKFEGVQEMACDTFLKISRSCTLCFVVQQPEDPLTFIDELARSDLVAHTCDLPIAHLQTFYEAVSVMISAVQYDRARERLVKQLLSVPNREMELLIGRAGEGEEVTRRIAEILRTHITVAKNVGVAYLPVLLHYYTAWITIYTQFSQEVTSFVHRQGTYAVNSMVVKGMRSVKRAILQLMKEVITRSTDDERVAKLVEERILPHLLDGILNDYHDSPAWAREPQVLLLAAAVVPRFPKEAASSVGPILALVTNVTLEMITVNYEDFPDHRLNFFKMLHAMCEGCFPALLAAVQQQQVIMEAILWSVKHTHREITETGLKILLQFLEQVSATELCSAYYEVYYFKLFHEIIAIMVDSLHASGFKWQYKIVNILVVVVAKGFVKFNLDTLREWMVKTLQAIGMGPSRSNDFLNTLVASSGDKQKFKSCLRDFLIYVKEKDNEAGEWRPAEPAEVTMA